MLGRRVGFSLRDVLLCRSERLHMRIRQIDFVSTRLRREDGNLSIVALVGSMLSLGVVQMFSGTVWEHCWDLLSPPSSDVVQCLLCLCGMLRGLAGFLWGSYGVWRVLAGVLVVFLQASWHYCKSFPGKKFFPTKNSVPTKISNFRL